MPDFSHLKEHWKRYKVFEILRIILISIAILGLLLWRFSSIEQRKTTMFFLLLLFSCLFGLGAYSIYFGLRHKELPRIYTLFFWCSVFKKVEPIRYYFQFAFFVVLALFSLVMLIMTIFFLLKEILL